MVSLTVRVLYGDTDQMGIVYYANYLRYFEAGRGELLRAHGCDYRQVEAQGYRLPVIEAHVRYVRPAQYDDLLGIETVVSQERAAVVRFNYRVVRGSDEIATGDTLHACLNAQGKPTRLPAALVSLFVGAR